MSTSADYRAYLLRLWCTAGGEWRAALVDPHTGEQRTFASLALLVEYLVRATGGGFDPADPEDPAPTGPG